MSKSRLMILTASAVLVGLVFFDPGALLLGDDPPTWVNHAPVIISCPESVNTCSQCNGSALCNTDLASCHEEERQPDKFDKTSMMGVTTVEGPDKPCLKKFRCKVQVGTPNCIRGDELPSSPSMRMTYKVQGT